MSTLLTQIVIAVLGADALFKFIEWLVERRDKQKDSPEKKMLRALGADRLEQKLKAWKHADVRTADEWANIKLMYEGYRDLGGNGSIRKLYEECEQIETTE